MFSIIHTRVGILLSFMLGIFLETTLGFWFGMIFLLGLGLLYVAFFVSQYRVISSFFFFAVTGLCWAVFYDAVVAGNAMVVALSYALEPVLAFFRDNKLFLSDVLRALFSEPHAGLLSGLLLGDRTGLSYDIRRLFQIVGLSHILAVSGYNVSLVLMYAGFLLRWMPHRPRLYANIGFMLFFLMLVGFEPSAIRASVMAMLVVLSVYLGRKKHVLWYVLVSAAGMTFFNPPMLVWDIGFQLSFAATLGLLVLAPFMGNHILAFVARFCSGKSPPGIITSVINLFAATAAAQMATFPIILWYFDEFPLIGFVSNIFIVPLVGLATLGGFCSLFLGMLMGSQVARFLVWPEEILLRIIIGLTVFFSNFVYPYRT